ncbi:hypothetical protein [Xenorhabdus sp. TS4]|nr:hypothetical protein [Xenorhabdus sp. TS4]MBC8949347.1 hypothetical protein [Xenorhabdus sp. TS4]
MKIKTSELTGRALDWAVCLAIGGTVNADNVQLRTYRLRRRFIM